MIQVALGGCEPPFGERCQVLDDMYEAVYMAQPGGESGPHGLLSEPELKQKLGLLRSAAGLGELRGASYQALGAVNLKRKPLGRQKAL